MVQGDLFKDILEKLEEKPVLIEDQLSFIDEAATLSEDIVNSKGCPYVLAIWGDWGTGKTSFMQILRSFLDEKYYEEALGQLSDEKGKIPKPYTKENDIYDIARKEGIYKDAENSISEKPCKTIWFRAWEEELHQEENKKTWESLFGQILREIHEDTQIHASLKKDKKQYKLFDSFYKAGLSFLKSYNSSQRLTDATFKGVMDFLKNFFFSTDEKTSIPSIDKNASLRTFRENFTEITNSSLFPYEKVVVFIDDLDRCDPQEAFRIVKSLKAFFETDKLVFVFGVEKKMLEIGFEMEREIMFGEKIGKKNSDSGELEIRHEVTFERYMEKIISEEKELDLLYKINYFQQKRFEKIINQFNSFFFKEVLRIQKVNGNKGSFEEYLFQNKGAKDLGIKFTNLLSLGSNNNIRRLKKIYRVFIKEMMNFLFSEDIFMKGVRQPRYKALINEKFSLPNLIYSIFAADSKNIFLRDLFQEKYYLFLKIQEGKILSDSEKKYFIDDKRREYVESLLQVIQLPPYYILIFFKFSWLRNINIVKTGNHDDIQFALKKALSGKSNIKIDDLLISINNELIESDNRESSIINGWQELICQDSEKEKYINETLNFVGDYRNLIFYEDIKELYQENEPYKNRISRLFEFINFIENSNKDITIRELVGCNDTMNNYIIEFDDTYTKAVQKLTAEKNNKNTQLLLLKSIKSLVQELDNQEIYFGSPFRKFDFILGNPIFNELFGERLKKI